MCFLSSRRRHTMCALVTGVQTWALPISGASKHECGQFAAQAAQGELQRHVGLNGVIKRDALEKLGRRAIWRTWLDALAAQAIEPVQQIRPQPACQFRTRQGKHFAQPTQAHGLQGGELTRVQADLRSEEHTSELQSLMRISYAVFCLNKTKNTI